MIKLGLLGILKEGARAFGDGGLPAERRGAMDGRGEVIRGGQGTRLTVMQA
jgi:hypothetical protein